MARDSIEGVRSGHDVFLSYKREDQHRVEAIVRGLRDSGLSVWWDQGLFGGDTWRRKISDALREAKVVVVAWSHVSVSWAGAFVHDEAAEALARGAYLPIKLDEVKQPLGFRSAHCLDLVDWVGDCSDPRFVHLIESVRKRISGDGGPRSEADVGDAFTIQFAEYRTLLRQRFRSLPWVDRAIDLTAQTPDGRTVHVVTHLMEWAQRTGPRSLVLLGEFGSGKTCTLLRFANELAESDRAVLPVLISCRDVLSGHRITDEDLRRLATPMPGAAVWRRVPKDLKLLILLDALDEVMDPADTKLSKHREVLEKVGEASPAGVSIALTCRTLFYQAVKDDVGPMLSSPQRPGPIDRTEEALAYVTTSSGGRPEVLALNGLSNGESDLYLTKGGAREVWSRLKSSIRLTDFASSPFSLRLLECVLPELTQDSELDLDELYDRAVRAMLDRDRRLSRAEFDEAFLAFEQLTHSEDVSNGHAIDAGMACEILVEGRNRSIGFRHRSFFEFFLARAIARQMHTYDAGTLARLNLISGYNVCRFLVPLLRRRYSCVGSHGSALSEARWVTSTEFADFTDATGWRRGLGHGVHPVEPSGAPQFATDSSLILDPAGFRRGLGPATRMSWFDAVQFCRWSRRTMLPGGQAVQTVQAKTREGALSWAGNWVDERRAYVSALRFGSEGQVLGVVGINPDYRSENLGLVVSAV